MFRKILKFPEHCPHPCQPGWLCGPRARSSFPHRSWLESGGRLRTAWLPGARSIREASGQVALSCPTYQGEGASVGAGTYPGPQPQAGVPPTGQSVGFGSYALAVTPPGEGGTMDVCTVTLGDGLTGRRGHRGTHAPSSAPSPCTPGPTMCREPSQTLKVWGGREPPGAPDHSAAGDAQRGSPPHPAPPRGLSGHTAGRRVSRTPSTAICSGKTTSRLAGPRLGDSGSPTLERVSQQSSLRHPPPEGRVDSPGACGPDVQRFQLGARAPPQGPHLPPSTPGLPPPALQLRAVPCLLAPDPLAWPMAWQGGGGRA